MSVNKNKKLAVSKSTKQSKTKQTHISESESESSNETKQVINEIIVKPKGKLTLTSMHVVATWEYDVENQDCALCHHDLMTPVLVTKNNQTTYENDVSIGSCKHGFHVPCVNSWIKCGNNSCPKCRVPLKNINNVSSAVYMYNPDQ